MEFNYIRANIKNMRRAAGITQREMSTRLFMDERTYSKIERGEKKSVDIGLLSSIADILKTDIATLMVDPNKETCVETKTTYETSTNISLTNVSIEDQQKMMEELRLLKEEVKELILCHKEALELIRNTQV